MTRSDDGHALVQEDTYTMSLEHLTNRETDPPRDAPNPMRDPLDDERRQRGLRIVSIEPSGSGDEPPMTRPNRVILAFARLVREALEAEDEATQQGA